MASIVSAGTTSATSLNLSADTSGVLQLASNNGTVALTIATTQYVNIGTTSSSYPFQITTNPAASSNPMLAINPATGTNASYIYFNNSGSGGFNVGRSDSAGAGSGLTLTAYDSFVATTGTTGLSFNTNNTRAMYIDSGQNVQIGTTTVINANQDVLTIGKNSTSYDAQIVLRQFGANTAVGMQMIAATDNGAAYNSIQSSTSGGTQHWKLGGVGGFTGGLAISTSGSERTRINATGQVCIGQTSSFGGMAPSRGSITLAGVNSTSDTNMGGVMINSYSTATGLPYYAGNWASTNAWGIGSHTGTNDNIVRIGQMTYTSAGMVWAASYSNIYAGTYTNASDYRIKENVENYTGGLQAVLALRPVLYNVKAEAAEEGKEQMTPRTEIGFIAHEFQESVPQLAIGTKDGMNADGTENHQAIDYAKFTAVLTSAIQELSAKVTALENK
jgi:hypothetical protein